MAKPPARPQLNIPLNFNGSQPPKKTLTLNIGGTSSPSGSTRPRSPAPFVFPTTPNSETEFHNIHAETDSKFHEIMNCTGKININGRIFRTAIEEMQDLGELGNGTCGHVVKMMHKPTGEVIAVKQMRRSGNRDENKRIIMDLEVVLKSHDCPYIVQCLGCFVTDSDVWICMELMTTCMDKLLKNLKQPLPEYIVGKVAVATVKALHYLKESHGVIHRDVKPSNILLDDKGNVKLCDFGISGRLVDSKAKTRTAGCTAYMAPERIDPPDPSKPNYDIRADVWSLGITLVELATGKFPYGDCATEFEVMTRILDDDPPELPTSGPYSEEFHSFVKLCLVKNYKVRPKYSKLLEHAFIKKSEAKPFDIRTWYNIVCGSSANRQQQLQSPSAASLNNYYLPSSGSSSVGRHSSRLRSSPSPSSTSSLMSIVTPNVPHPSNHQHRLGSAGSSTSSSSGYHTSSMISPRTPIRTTPSPLSVKPSRYEEFALPSAGSGSNSGSGRSNSTQHYQPQHYPQHAHRTAFDRLNSEPLPNVRSPQTPHSPNPSYTVQPPDPPPRMNRIGSSDGCNSKNSSPMTPNELLFAKAVGNSNTPIPGTSNGGPAMAPAGATGNNSPPTNDIPTPSSQSLRRYFCSKLFFTPEPTRKRFFSFNSSSYMNYQPFPR